MLIDVHHPSHGATLRRPDTTTITFAESSVDFPFAFVSVAEDFFSLISLSLGIMGSERYRR